MTILNDDTPTASSPTPPGMRTFFTVWGGQLISVVGTTMSGFGLSIWVYVETGSVTKLAMASLAFALPATLLAPVAGALVDRWDRRVVMLAADTIAGMGTLAIAILYMNDALQLWHIYLVAAVGAIANTFQMPAWLASIPLLVPKQHLGRANGMVQLNDGLSMVVAPVIAGVLLAAYDLPGVLIVDLATFVVAVVTLGMVRFPRPEGHAETSTGSLRGDAVAGWRWVKDRPGLFGLLWIFAGVNFTLSFINVLLFPLVLSFASEASAGTVLSVAGLGVVVGSVAVSAWGGPKRRIRGLMGSIAIGGVFLAAAGVHAAVWAIAVASFCFMAVVPIANTASQVLWQVKVPPALQGRVFSIRRMISQAIAPIAILAAGPLADKVFEPMFAPGGSLAGSIGSVIGTGPGRGIGFMFIVSGLATAALAVFGYVLPRIRHVEDELPDYVG
jgi:DHA3 family macrolide efflux protein-like MFS transporter